MEESFWKQTYEEDSDWNGSLWDYIEFSLSQSDSSLPWCPFAVCGFRKLRLENRWLKAGYAGAALKVVITIVNIVIGSVLERGENLCFICMESELFSVAEFCRFSDGFVSSLVCVRNWKSVRRK